MFYVFLCFLSSGLVMKNSKVVKIQGLSKLLEIVKTEKIAKMIKNCKNGKNCKNMLLNFTKCVDGRTCHELLTRIL